MPGDISKGATHCNSLQHTATRSYTLQHTATHCNKFARRHRCFTRQWMSCGISKGATHCNTLHHTATHCNTMQHTATHCNTSPHTATYCNTPARRHRCFTRQWMPCDNSKGATHCNTLQHTATHCNTLARRHRCFTCQWLPCDISQGATHCNTLHHNATNCHTLPHTATHCDTLQHTCSPTPLLYTLVNALWHFKRCVVKYPCVCQDPSICVIHCHIHSHARHVIRIHPHLWHDFHTYDITRSVHVTRRFEMYQPFNTRDSAFEISEGASWFIHVCDTTHPCECHDSSLCVT